MGKRAEPLQGSCGSSRESKLARLVALGFTSRACGASSGEPVRTLQQGVLPLGIAALDNVLPDGGFPRGAVTELQAHGLQGCTTSLALLACRAAQQYPLLPGDSQPWANSAASLLKERGPPISRQEGEGPPGVSGSLADSPIEGRAARAAPRHVLELSHSGGSSLHPWSEGPLPAWGRGERSQGVGAWCAFIDPAATLYAPGVNHSGVALDRLLVVRPPPNAIARVALKIVASRVVSVLVIDTVGLAGPLEGLGPSWQRSVRRLTIAVRESSLCVLLTTRATQKSSVPLPVALRLELCRPRPEELLLRVAKERFGRVTNPVCLAWPVSAPVAPKPI